MIIKQSQDTRVVSKIGTVKGKTRCRTVMFIINNHTCVLFLL